VEWAMREAAAKLKELPGGIPAKSWSHARYLKDGTDFILQFGRYRGRRISQMAAPGVNKEERGYLRRILKEDFPDELKNAIKVLLGIPVE